MDLSFCYERYGGIQNKFGFPRLVFTGAIVDTGWPDFPYAANARITEDSYDKFGQKMMAAGDPCIVLFDDWGPHMTLPACEWKQNINVPKQLKELVNELRADRIVRERIRGH